MDNLAKEIAQLDAEQVERILQQVSGLTAVVISALTERAKERSFRTVAPDGSVESETRSTVNTTSMRQIMREVDRFETELQSALYSETLSAMDAAAVATIAFLQSEVGAKNKYKVNVEETLGNKVLIGDRTFDQRTKLTASDIANDVRKIVRQGLLAGEDVGSIINKVSQSVKDSDWKIIRIVESEIYTAYRYQFGETASKNGFDWIKIHESFPRHPRRRQHRCYPLANTDKYGMGKGVYKSTDVEIFFPHPQCTSWLEVVEVLD